MIVEGKFWEWLGEGGYWGRRRRRGLVLCVVVYGVMLIKANMIIICLNDTYAKYLKVDVLISAISGDCYLPSLSSKYGEMGTGSFREGL